MTSQYWFKSSLFNIVPGEDKETNPYCYGKELAEWLRQHFSSSNNEPEEIIAEDWGWCVMLQREPYMLWLGCGSLLDDDTDTEELNSKSVNSDDITWTCFIGNDIPFWSGYFWKRLFKKDKLVDNDTRRISQRLMTLFENNKHITLVDEP